MAPAGLLDMSIRRRGDVVELALAGDLDLATVHVLREAMTWLRFTQERGQAIVIDTQALDFVAVAGYRALRAELVQPGGAPDPKVTCIVGPVIARFESALGTALAQSGGCVPPRARGPRTLTHNSLDTTPPRRPRAARANQATGALPSTSRWSWPRSTTRQSPWPRCVRSPSRQPRADG
jgi:hypothetical protein